MDLKQTPMKRIHLFEFEDFSWFPNWLRQPMTHYIAAMHKMLGTSETVADIIAKALKNKPITQITDLCSGNGGPMPDVVDVLEKKHGFKDLQLHLSDLYPNMEAAKSINAKQDSNIKYITKPVNATSLGKEHKGLRTMMCSLHHMKPAVAKSILKDAKDAKQPICIFEISDNSAPLFIAWIAIPIAAIMTLFITPFVRPMTWQQIVFTYFIPILPLVIGWDGGISNMRTYTLSDMDELTKDLQSDDYKWEKGAVAGKGGKKLYLMGMPQ